MEDDRSCSSKWPRYAMFAYATVAVVAGSVLIGVGVYFHINGQEFHKLFANNLQASVAEDFNMSTFLFGSCLAVGICMIISSLSLALCGAYKMNKSCVATYMTVTIFCFVLAAAVGLVVVAHEPRFIDDLTRKSLKLEIERKVLDGFTKIVMVVTLIIASFQMVGAMIACCLLKAVEDLNK